VLQVIIVHNVFYCSR